MTKLLLGSLRDAKQKLRYVAVEALAVIQSKVPVIVAGMVETMAKEYQEVLLSRFQRGKTAFLNEEGSVRFRPISTHPEESSAPSSPSLKSSNGNTDNSNTNGELSENSYNSYNSSNGTLTERSTFRRWSAQNTNNNNNSASNTIGTANSNGSFDTNPLSSSGNNSSEDGDSFNSGEISNLIDDIPTLHSFKSKSSSMIEQVQSKKISNSNNSNSNNNNSNSGKNNDYTPSFGTTRPRRRTSSFADLQLE